MSWEVTADIPHGSNAGLFPFHGSVGSSNTAEEERI